MSSFVAVVVVRANFVVDEDVDVDVDEAQRVSSLNLLSLHLDDDADEGIVEETMCVNESVGAQGPGDNIVADVDDEIAQ